MTHFDHKNDLINTGVRSEVKSNWNLFEIRSIWFKNLRFDWFKIAKNIPKIRWKSIQIWFVRFNFNFRVESNFQKLYSFEIRSIRFKNLQFDWFKRTKNVRKIRWKLIRNLFDSTPTIGQSQIFQMLDSFEIHSIQKIAIRLIRRWKIIQKIR